MLNSTRRLAATAVAAATSVALLGGAGQAFAEGHAPVAAKPAAKLTVAGYTKYLKAQKTPEARKTLTRFSALSKAQKAQFVKYLQDRNVYRALVDNTKGSLGRQLHITDPYNKDVKFVTDVISKVAKDKNKTTSIKFSVTERIFDIPVTSETISLHYAKGKKGHVAIKATASVSNVNAAIAISHGPVRATDRGAVVSAATRWTAKPQVQSFGKKVVKEQSVWAGAGYWSAKLANAGK